MSKTLEQVQTLVARGEVRISDHGYDELAKDDIFTVDVLAGLNAAKIVEDYPDAERGPSVLVLQETAGSPIHVVWGIPKGRSTPAVLITAYRPDPKRWSADFMRRKKP
ncbi:MAG: DUF4258 domain-containing protein [Bradyrhizobiaceae bacterium]|nr:DUF4258 domain-containing protein [Bradyrhizobiaceae bacterium]